MTLRSHSWWQMCVATGVAAGDGVVGGGGGSAAVATMGARCEL